jgi:subtilisin family serine protease
LSFCIPAPAPCHSRPSHANSHTPTPLSSPHPHPYSPGSLYTAPPAQALPRPTILTKRQEFQGRATWLANFIDRDDTDGAGHGTHVAGTIGGVTYGVAKKTQLYAVKVLNAGGSGTYSSVIAGIDFVAADAANRTSAGECPNGVVSNMSLGGGKSAAVNSAVAAAVRAGVFFAVAAGNAADDSAFWSPASEPTACTVGATDVDDVNAWFSNYGSVVDIYAPGVDVLSAWIGGVDDTVSGSPFFSSHFSLRKRWR